MKEDPSPKANLSYGPGKQHTKSTKHVSEPGNIFAAASVTVTASAKSQVYSQHLLAQVWLGKQLPVPVAFIHCKQFGSCFMIPPLFLF